MRGTCSQSALHSSSQLTLSSLPCCCLLLSPTDLGSDGIAHFLQLHQCSRFCRKQWVRAGMRPSVKLTMQKGTTMSLPFEPKQPADALTGRRRFNRKQEKEQEEEEEQMDEEA